jgi:hypothetical protein
MAFVLCFTLALPVLASAQAATDEVSMEEAEVTEWCFRVYNGQRQRRLWSVTYEYWITDWEAF